MRVSVCVCDWADVSNKSICLKFTHWSFTVIVFHFCFHFVHLTNFKVYSMFVCLFFLNFQLKWFFFQKKSISRSQNKGPHNHWPIENDSSKWRTRAQRRATIEHSPKYLRNRIVKKKKWTRTHTESTSLVLCTTYERRLVELWIQLIFCIF